MAKFGIKQLFFKLRRRTELKNSLIVMIDPEVHPNCEEYYQSIVEEIMNPGTGRYLLFRLDNMLREFGFSSRHAASEYFNIPFMQVMRYGWRNLNDIQSEYIECNGKKIFKIRFLMPYLVV